ncbi:MAG TPA: Ig-like domain-containing protein [Cytophagales bacterium]|nr:Ig-like domain-containing protein [Cytophagales bacterium]
MNLIKSLFLLLITLPLILFLSSCANRKSPSGGEKDTKGPEIVLSIPENKVLNFTGTKLYFEFDEFIKEDNLAQKIIISPALDSTFTHKIIKKRLYITFNKKLKDNTTYTLNMGAGIKDITEGNPGTNLKYIFSTGTFIDSLNISGNVVDLETGKPVKEALIGLYLAADTITPFNGKPYYIGRTDEQGKFLLENLKEDNYLLYTFIDQNRDLKYSGAMEPIGFIRDTIKLDSSVQSLNIPTQKFDLRELIVIRSGSEDETAVIDFNKGLKEVSLNYTLDSTEKILYTFNDAKNKINIFNTIGKYDSLPLHIVSLDSFDIKLDTTLNILFTKAEEENIKKKNKNNKEEEDVRQTFTLSVSPSNKNILSTTEIELESKLPVTTYNIEKIYFFKDSLTTYPLDTSEIRWNKNMTTLKIKKNIPFADTIRFKAEYGALLNVKGDTNLLANHIFLKKRSEKYSIIGGAVDINANSFIIQLIKKENKKVLEIKNTKKFKFDYLEPGKYSLRVLIDENKNGKWDRGDLKERIEPEKIIFYTLTDSKGNPTTEIELKANWELLENIITE